jgi:signal transduction histidine kinase
MKLLDGDILRRLRELRRETAATSAEMTQRLRVVERNIVLPVKLLVVALFFYSLFYTRWFEGLSDYMLRAIGQELVERFFLIYLIWAVPAALLLVFESRFSPRMMNRLILATNWADTLFLAALTFATGGHESPVYWLFLGLIIRNAVSIALAWPQVLLNVSASVLYLAACLVESAVNAQTFEYDDGLRLPAEGVTEIVVLRLFVLWLLMACCYGLQVLLEKHRMAAEEAREFAAVQGKLQAEGRLAAGIAHQIKNPLSIINNTAFSMQRAIDLGKPANPAHLTVVREGVERIDHIVTQLTGYAQLLEGRVERLRFEDELDRALADVFPPGSPYDVAIVKDLAPHLPPLLMQRGHLAEILVNLLKNAREALEGRGQVRISAREAENHTVLISLSDNGPGIPSDRLERIFEPYYTSKPGGSGLGLAIVRHNAEVYGGSVRAESELGKGATFIVTLPTRTFLKVKA